MRSSIVVAAFILAGPVSSVAQDAAPPGPCRAAACRVSFDWGGESAASHSSDRRYGAASDVETLLPQFFTERGLRVVTTGDASLILTVRPKVRRAMCDVLPGTSTDYNCKTIGEISVQFTATDSSRAPNAVRVTNRCGAGDTFMNVADFTRYTVDYIIYQISDEKTRGRRPSAKC